MNNVNTQERKLVTRGELDLDDDQPEPIVSDLIGISNMHRRMVSKVSRASPVFLADMKNGKDRLVIDYRGLNAQT